MCPGSLSVCGASLNLCLLESCLENLSLSLCLSLYVCFMIVCSVCLCLCLLYVAVPHKGLYFIELHRKHRMVGKKWDILQKSLIGFYKGLSQWLQRTQLTRTTKSITIIIVYQPISLEGNSFDCLQPRFLLFSAKGTHVLLWVRSME